MDRNKLELAGNLTRDPEIKYTPKGTAIAQFGIAVNRVWYDEKEKREEVDFFDCEAWGRTAENIGEYFKKGTPIFIDARLKNESWDDKETGKKRYKLKIVVETFGFMGGKKSSGETTRPIAGDRQPPRSAPRPPVYPDLDVENVPF